MDVYNSKIAKSLAYLMNKNTMAITISATCTLWSESEQRVKVDTRWLSHEWSHKASIADRQFRKGKYYGWLDWMATYLWRMVTVGYSNSEEEKEARDAANNS